MATETVELLVEGGKATAAPPLGPSLAPLGLNVGEIVSTINEQTKSFQGMKVPVKVVADTEDKSFDISVGTPPATALLKKEAGIEKASGSPASDKVADLKIEQIIKVAKMKENDLQGKTLKEKVKEVIGTCVSMGILVEGVEPFEATDQVNEGKYDQEIKDEKTELSAQELAQLEREKKKLAKEMEERRAEFEATGKEILASMAGKESHEIKAALEEAEIPTEIINELMPKEEGAKPAEGEAKPAEGDDKPAEEEQKED